MNFDKNLWERSISLMSTDKLPSWPCPTCGSGKLVFKQETLHFQESARQFDEGEFRKEDFEENIILGIITALAKATSRLFIRQSRFNAFLICNNSACHEAVTVSGRAEVPVALQKDNRIKTTPMILPEYFSPSLKIFPLPNDYPGPIREELARSFTIFFADSSAAGNKLRTAIERLMDELKIGDSSEKLHRRLEQFSKKFPDLGEMTMEIKWLGNEASHCSALSKSKILDGYQIFEYVLKQLFTEPAKREKIKRLSKGLKPTP